MWAFIALAVLAVYQVTPTDIFTELFHPKDVMDNATSASMVFWQTLAVYAAMKVTAAALRWVLIRAACVHPEHATDVYVLLTNPNIFLWLGLANAVSEVDVTYLRFWAVLLFFLLPMLEQFVITHAFMRKMAALTIKTSRVSLAQLQEVWAKVAPSGANALDIEGVRKFVYYVQAATTGFTENVPDYVAQQLMQSLDTDGSGYVEQGELFTYVSSVGMVIDLNGLPRTAASEMRGANTADAHEAAHLSKGARDIAHSFIQHLANKKDRAASLPLRGGALSNGHADLSHVPITVLNAQGKWAKATLLALGGQSSDGEASETSEITIEEV